MSDDPKIVGFPKPDVPPEEMVRRQRVEAERLARLSPGEWQLWIDNSAAQLGIPRVILEDSVKAIVAQLEKDKRERKAEDRQQERRVEKAQERADKEVERARKEAERIERAQEIRRKKREAVFAEIVKLPQLTHTTRLKEAAVRLGEDLDDLQEEFEVYFAARSIPAELELWPEPVDTAELLAEIETKFRRYVVVSDTIGAAVALWVAFTYVVEIAVHAPKLLFHFPEKDAGKSTALGVLRHMVQRPYAAVEATGAAVYRIVDRLRPTLLLNEADKLFQRNTMLAHIINASWTNGGQKIPRVGPGGVVVEYDPTAHKQSRQRA